MKKHFNIKIHGKVQGVFFRISAKRKADELDLVGIVRNEGDRTVYIEVEGEEEALDKFLDWCNQGSDYAKVEKVEAKEVGLKEYDSFDIVDLSSNTKLF